MWLMSEWPIVESLSAPSGVDILSPTANISYAFFLNLKLWLMTSHIDKTAVKLATF